MAEIDLKLDPEEAEAVKESLEIVSAQKAESYHVSQRNALVGRVLGRLTALMRSAGILK